MNPNFSSDFDAKRVRGVAVLGSTGTIGINTLDILERFPDKFRLVSMAAGRNIGKLREQIKRFNPQHVCFQQEDLIHELKSEFSEVEFSTGTGGLESCINEGGVDVVVVGIVGFQALFPTLAAIRAHKIIALANKEAVIVGGELLKKEMKKHLCSVIPVDSEHNALFQLLQGRDVSTLRSIVLTASGGPFINKAGHELNEVTPEQAIRHPNWKMGHKISVDSATLMNKGLEIIEAAFLFNVPESRIEVWIHPQSIVHGAVWFCDNTCLAQLSKPDMRSSIGYALSYPDRLPDVIPRISLKELSSLEFYDPDVRRFPALTLAREALRSGPSHLVALNASNEVAVESFLSGRIRFTQIAQVVSEVLSSHVSESIDSLENIFALDESSRQIAQSVVKKLMK